MKFLVFYLGQGSENIREIVHDDFLSCISTNLSDQLGFDS